MARNYGRFTTTIWRDPDFTSLTQPLQAVYFMLCTQPEVSAAGTLPLTLQRWSRLAAGLNRDELTKQLHELAESPGRHVVIDEDSEELLIRKFIKWDQGWYNEKRWPLVRDAVSSIASVDIRDAAVDELRRLALSNGQSDTASKRVLDWLSDAVPDGESGFDRSGLSKWGTDRNPLTATHTPQPALLEGEPSGDAGPLSPFCDEHPQGTDEPCRKCATRRTAYAAAHEQKMAAEIEARKAVAAARAACELCDDKGMRLHPSSRQPIGRCDHRPVDDAPATVAQEDAVR